MEDWGSVGDSPNAGVCLNKAVGELTLLDFFQAQASISSDSHLYWFEHPCAGTGFEIRALHNFFSSMATHREIVDTLSHSWSS